MEFITILIVLAVEQYYKKAENYRNCDWFGYYCDWLKQKTDSLASLLPSAMGPLSLLLLLAPILILVILVENTLAGMGSLFSFIFGLIVLIYSIGPRDISNQVGQYIESLSSGDVDTALEHANTFFSGHHYKPEIEGSPQQIAAIMKRGILLAFSNRILAVLFWFIILGPLGALTYRLTIFLLERFAGGYFGHNGDDTLETDNDDDLKSEFKMAVQRLYMILSWVPARLCVITFALAGSFSDTLFCWRCAADFVNKNNDELIVESGLHALKMDVEPSITESAESYDSAEDIADVEQVMALVKWSLLIVITITALMTIVGWIY